MAARLRGSTLHKILETFVRARPGIASGTEKERLLAIADEVLQEEVSWPAARMLWRARLERAADFFLSVDGADGGIPVSDGALRFDLPVMTVVAVACLPIFFSGHRIARWEGALFLGYYVAYTAWLLMAHAQHDALDDFRAVMLWVAVPLTVVTLAVVAWRNLRAHRRATGGAG